MHTSKIKKEQGRWWNKAKHQVNLACGFETFLETLMSVVLAHELREKICCWSWNIISWNVFSQPQSEKKIWIYCPKAVNVKGHEFKEKRENLVQVGSIENSHDEATRYHKKERKHVLTKRYHCLWLDNMAPATKYLWKDFFPKGKNSWCLCNCNSEI